MLVKSVLGVEVSIDGLIKDAGLISEDVYK